MTVSRLPKDFSIKHIFTLPGQYFYMFPDKTYYARLTAIGGGGSGGWTALGGGGGGGAGGFFQGIFRVSPNIPYVINVGYGGKQTIDYGNGFGNGTETSFGIVGQSLIGTTGYGTSPQTNAGNAANNAGRGVGGIVNCPLATLTYNGGYGGFGSYTHASLRAGGGGGGIGLAYGSNATDGSANLIAIGGSGAGSFGGHAGASAYITGTTGASGGGGGISFKGGDASSATGLQYAGGGASIFGNALYFYGGPDADGVLANGANATTNRGGGGGGAKANAVVGYLGAMIIPTLSSPNFGCPSSAQLFFSIFNCISGASGGTYASSVTSGARGQDSICGGGTGAVNTTAATSGFTGGNSTICGGGGGAAGNATTIALNYAKGGDGAGGGGGGGGAVAGNGGQGLFIVEFGEQL